MNILLTTEQQIILSHIKDYVAQKLADDFSGHDLAHIERVVRLSEYLFIHNETAANGFVVLLSAYLHDVIDEKVVPDVSKARSDLQQLLKNENVSAEMVEAVFDIIDNMSYSKNLMQKKVLSLEGQIVQDADRLDALGAIGIGRTFYYGGNKHNIMHDPNILHRQQLDESRYRQANTVINHFYEKLLLLKYQMNTQAAKQLAEKRHQFLVEFVTRFENEWLGNFEN